MGRKDEATSRVQCGWDEDGPLPASERGGTRRSDRRANRKGVRAARRGGGGPPEFNSQPACDSTRQLTNAKDAVRRQNRCSGTVTKRRRERGRGKRRGKGREGKGREGKGRERGREAKEEGGREPWATTVVVGP